MTTTLTPFREFCREHAVTAGTWLVVGGDRWRVTSVGHHKVAAECGDRLRYLGRGEVGRALTREGGGA